MSLHGWIRMDCDEVFEVGCGLVGGVGPLSDFDRSTRENKVQARDEETGLPLWQVDVLDFDPEAWERTHRVIIAAPVQPVPPDAVEGAPVRPVYLEGLRVKPYCKAGSIDKNTGQKRYKLAFMLQADGLAAPRHGSRSSSNGSESLPGSAGSPGSSGSHSKVA